MVSRAPKVQKSQLNFRSSTSSAELQEFNNVVWASGVQQSGLIYRPPELRELNKTSRALGDLQEL
jgi:hypothetical protein